MNKTEARKNMRVLRDKLAESERAVFGAQIAENLFGIDGFWGFEDYFVYLSFGSEVATDEIIDGLLRRGKKVYVPKIIGGEMFAVKFKPPFAVNKFGVKEPTEAFYADKIDVSVTPLIAADGQFNRVGYGKGYYDRFFEKNACYKIGVCYSVQVADEIETEVTDVPLDMLITEKYVFERKKL